MLNRIWSEDSFGHSSILYVISGYSFAFLFGFLLIRLLDFVQIKLIWFSLPFLVGEAGGRLAHLLITLVLLNLHEGKFKAF